MWSPPSGRTSRCTACDRRRHRRDTGLRRRVSGRVLYAVKCNPEPAIMRAVRGGGVAHFDCASPAEVRLVRQMFPDAAIHYMHPVKARGAIREAWAQHGVRDFVLDSQEELAKILDETGDRRRRRAWPDRSPGSAERRAVL